MKKILLLLSVFFIVPVQSMEQNNIKKKLYSSMLSFYGTVISSSYCLRKAEQLESNIDQERYYKKTESHLKPQSKYEQSLSKNTFDNKVYKHGLLRGTGITLLVCSLYQAAYIKKEICEITKLKSKMPQPPL
jgi:hypothetical protein